MTTRTIALQSLVVLLALTTAAEAQKTPAIRPLGPVVARSTETISNQTPVRHLPRGVLVNDVARRRVLLFDSTLTSFTVIADTTSATSNAYSGRVAGLIAYRGDSTLFVDPTSLSMLVIDPSGKVGRVMSVPRTQDAMMLAATAFGAPGFDASGKLVYRSNFRPQMRGMGPGGPISPPEMPDSAPIVRIDLATRTLDTVAFIKTPKVKMDVNRSEDGRISMTTQINPLPVVDDWAVLANGSIAVVRGQDYHVDIFSADGKKTSATKMPFEWQRLSDEDKVAFIDSVKAARERMIAQQESGAPVPGGGVAPPGAGVQTQVMVFGGPAGGGGGGAAPAAAGAPRAGRVSFVEPSELPDYKPPFFAGSLRADADGNVWIRTIPTKAIPGGPVYDVVNGKGELVDRVQIPAGRTIVGFGAGGVVYLNAREKDANYLERARVR
jgi:hypothetical protein